MSEGVWLKMFGVAEFVTFVDQPLQTVLLFELVRFAAHHWIRAKLPEHPNQNFFLSSFVETD